MKQVSLSNNVTVVFNRSVYDDFSTQEVEEKIKTAYSGQDPEVGSTNFPNELKAVFSTNLQLQVVGQGKSIIVADTKINETNEASSTDIVRLASSIHKTMAEKSLVARMFGFNFVFTFQEIEFADLQQKIKSKYFKPDLAVEDADIKYALPNVSYEEGSTRYTLKYDVEMDEESNFSKVNVLCNVHFSNTEALKSDEELVALYKESYTRVYGIVGDLDD